MGVDSNERTVFSREMHVYLEPPFVPPSVKGGCPKDGGVRITHSCEDNEKVVHARQRRATTDENHVGVGSDECTAFSRER